jgi:hypothetical protein
MKYRKKPVIIEAIQWLGENEKEIFDFVEDKYHMNGDGVLVIETIEGEHIASVGDYIIKGVKGEFYPCKADIFHQTYEEVENNDI